MNDELEKMEGETLAELPAGFRKGPEGRVAGILKSRRTGWRLRRMGVAALLVIGLDGVPYGWLRGIVAQGKLPHLASLLSGGYLTVA